MIPEGHNKKPFSADPRSPVRVQEIWNVLEHSEPSNALPGPI